MVIFMPYIAHKDQTGDRLQSVAAHLLGTAELAAGFAAAFGAEDEGRRCGMLHDIGKYSDAFQRRINGSPERVDHSTAGAWEAARLKDVCAAFCIAGHHGGLPDGGTKMDPPDGTTLHSRLNRAEHGGIEDFGAFRREVDIPAASPPPALVGSARESLFFIRMLYSCLVDADYLDTESFMRGTDSDRGGFPPLEEYRERLLSHILPWLENPSGDLGEMRSEILRAAISVGDAPRGLFTFTAPTGSGKTVSSMAFALSHARALGLRRVVYVIPYCSIIEQTQSVFEDIFGDGSIVAHYSDVEYETGEYRAAGERDKRYLAAENWDAPVVLTTTVQFFESLFGSRPSRCRKLHNLAGSVLIFDEAQMLPAPYLRPCAAAISELIRNYGCSAVLCTATQPALDRLFEEFLSSAAPRELCPRRGEMYERFRRVRYERAGTLSDEALASRLAEHKQALCVVNRRDQAQELYAMLPEEGRFHLSTAMCPSDRRVKLDEIRARLKSGGVCRVVSTSLVEAGVDVDFPVVFRALAGLDSIVQAGGRCNREGTPGIVNGVVYIFESDRPAPRMLAQNIAAAKYALEKYPDPASPEAISAYFNKLFYFEKGMEALDAKEILKLCESGAFPFSEISARFRVIDSSQYSVYIPLPGSESLFSKLERFGPSRSVMRKLGQYAVGVYPEHYAELAGAGVVRGVAENAAVLEDMALYDRNTGLKLTVDEGRGNFI
jgi:CRISPR-associated endonuclease/helicase Cas3